MRRAVSAALLACAVAGLVACAREVPQLRYYTLAVPGGRAGALNAPVRVGAFGVDPPYATERLAYRTSPYRLDYYVYHRWAGNPGWMVAAAVRDYLEAAAGEPAAAPIEVGGNVRRLEEVDGGNGQAGAVALDLRVTRGGRLILERSYAETERAEGRGPEAATAALSRALGRILERFLADLLAAARG